MATRKSVVLQGFYLFSIFVRFLRSEENLSQGKTASQSTTYNSKWRAESAVDGCLGQLFSSADCCTHTDVNEIEAWWQVNIGGLATVSYITIYYRAAFQIRFAGYQLYLSNTTDWTTGYLCYQDTSSHKEAVELIVTHACPYVARFVTIYNYRGTPKRHDWYSDDAILELCEVQVFGCQIGQYGFGACNQTCPENCYGGNCDASTGSCFYCHPGKWGHSCQDDCLINCKACGPSDGLCTECVPGKYGEICDKDCPVNCNGTCDQDTSYCRDCVFGKWGDTCDQDCSHSCRDCVQNDGSCIDCSVGSYGQSCDLYCPTHCKGDACDRESGLCFECKPGKRGDKCDFDCSTFCKDLYCEQNMGICSECVDGMYGYYCDQSCTEGCESNRCRRYDGTCDVTRLGETDKPIEITRVDTITVVALAVVAAIFLVAAIVAFVCMLRFRSAAKKNQSKEEEHYTNIGQSGVNPNIYERATPQ